MPDPATTAAIQAQIAAAQAANAAYRQANQTGIPVPVGMDPATYLALHSEAGQEASEAAKYAAAYSQPRTVEATLAATASPAFLALQSAYAQQRYSINEGYYTPIRNPQFSVTPENPPMNTAAAIAARLASTGGIINPVVGGIAVSEGYTGPVNMPRPIGVNPVSTPPEGMTFVDYVSGKQTAYEMELRNYNAAGANNPTIYSDLISKKNELQNLTLIESGMMTARSVLGVNDLVLKKTPPTPIASSPGLINASALFAIPGMMAITQGTTTAETGLRNFFSGMEKAADVALPAMAPLTNFTGGLIEAFPETFMASAYLIPAAAAFITQPKAFAAAIIPGLIQQASQVSTQFTEDPFRLAGNVAGMIVFGHVMGKVTNIGGEYISEHITGINPISLKVGVPLRAGTEGEFNYVSTIGTKNPFTTNAPTIRAYAISGIDVTGTEFGWGSPTTAMKDLTITADPIFNVRDMTSVHVMTEPQRLLLDPFFRDVAAGTPNEPFINAVFDMKANIGANIRGGSEEILKYTNAQPAGTLTQTGIDAQVQTNVHEILADVGATRLGSAAQTDWLGSRFMRSTLGSDIDVDIPKANYKTAIEQLKTAYSQNIEPVRLPQTGGKFSLMKNPESETIISPGTMEKFADVRSLEATTTSGKIIGQQTPEYGMESKASRSFGGRLLEYNPDTGIEINIHETKFSKDVADIYAASRGVARTAYEQNQFKMGQTYESISDNLKLYAQSKGMAGVIEEIPEDILKTPEAIQAKAISGIRSGAYKPQVFGVDLPNFGGAESDYPSTHYAEPRGTSDYGYPISITSIGSGGRLANAPMISQLNNYPGAIHNTIMDLPVNYPLAISSRSPSPGYPTAISVLASPDNTSFASLYPIAEVVANTKPYPEIIRYPDSNNLPANIVYPTNENYPPGYLPKNPPLPYPPSGLPDYPPYTPPYTPPPYVPPPYIPPYNPPTYTPGGGGGGGTELIPPPVIITPPPLIPPSEIPVYWERSKRKKHPARFLELFSFEMGTTSPVPTRFGLGGVNAKALGRQPARFMELFSLEEGTTSAIPTRFGKGGVNTRAQRGNPEARFIPGYRGYAGKILAPEDIAPQGLFDIVGKGQRKGRRRTVWENMIS